MKPWIELVGCFLITVIMFSALGIIVAAGIELLQQLEQLMGPWLTIL